MTRSVPFLLLAVLFAGVLASPAPAASQNKAVEKLVQDFLADGEIDPCKHSEADLKLTKKLITPDIEQYVPDMRDLIDAALEARARGDCDKKAAAPRQTPTPAPTASPTATPKPERDKAAGPAATASPTPTTTVVADPPAPLANSRPQTKDDGRVTRVASIDPANSQPAPVVWLFVVGGALVLTLMTLLALRLTGVGEQRVAGLRHAWGEAAWRAQGAWQNFLDFLRLGR